MKKFLSILLAVMMILSVSAITASAQTVSDYAISENEGATADSVNGTAVGYVGDADMSDDVSIKDATAIQKQIAQLLTFTDTQKLLADADLSGDISIKDATAIQKWLAKIEVAAPVYHLMYKPVAEASITGAWATDIDLADSINDTIPLYNDDPLLLEYVNISTFPARAIFNYTDKNTFTMYYDETIMLNSIALVKKELEGDMYNYIAATLKQNNINMSVEAFLPYMGYSSMTELVNDMFPEEMVEELTTPMTGTYKVDGNKLYMSAEGEAESDYYETIEVTDTTLTFTGNSEGIDADSYPLVFYAVK